MKKFISIILIVLFGLVLFCGCGEDTENNRKDAGDENYQIIELTKQNYSNYLLLQSETISYSTSESISSYTGGKIITVNKTTKFSFIKLLDIISFDNVKANIKTNRPQVVNQSIPNVWLSLSYDGTGIATLSETYTYTSTNYGYSICQILGKITIKGDN